jgi:hypothetical protein
MPWRGQLRLSEPRLKPEDVSALVERIVKAIEVTKLLEQVRAILSMGALIKPVGAHAPQLKVENVDAPLKVEEADAPRLALESLERTLELDQQHDLAHAFAALAPRLKPEEALSLAGQIIVAVKRVTKGTRRGQGDQTAGRYLGRDRLAQGSTGKRSDQAAAAPEIRRALTLCRARRDTAAAERLCQKLVQRLQTVPLGQNDIEEAPPAALRDCVLRQVGIRDHLLRGA